MFSLFLIGILLAVSANGQNDDSVIGLPEVLDTLLPGILLPPATFKTITPPATTNKPWTKPPLQTLPPVTLLPPLTIGTLPPVETLPPITLPPLTLGTLPPLTLGTLPPLTTQPPATTQLPTTQPPVTMPPTTQGPSESEPSWTTTPPIVTNSPPTTASDEPSNSFPTTTVLSEVSSSGTQQPTNEPSEPGFTTTVEQTMPTDSQGQASSTAETAEPPTIPTTEAPPFGNATATDPSLPWFEQLRNDAPSANRATTALTFFGPIAFFFATSLL